MSIWKICGLSAVALAISCGGDEPSLPAVDSGTLDSSIDMRPDMTNDASSDLPTDAGVLCGNGVLNTNEACDNTVFKDDPTCGSLGLPNGSLGCTETCTVDSSACAVCDDGICSDGETASSCVQDCGVKSIAAGRTHTCSALADGSLWCWGARDGHRMGGTTDTNVPVRVPGHDNVVQVTVGDHHTCFLNTDAEVFCFGANGFGEAGQPPSPKVFPPAKVASADFSTAVKVVAAGNHTCAIGTTNNDVFCWGRGDYGQRGAGEFSMRNDVPTAISPDWAAGGTVFPKRPIVDIALGVRSTCKVSDLGIQLFDTDYVRCWGENTTGWLGDDLFWKDAPATVFGVFIPGLQIKSASVGHSHACFHSELTDGSMTQLWCLGGNAYGQTGLEPSTDSLTGKAFPGTYAPVVTGYSYTCAQDLNTPSAPNLLCWGNNYFGQLGDASLDSHYEPADVVGVDEVTQLSGGVDHVCAILPDETARCWGRNREGQLGNGSDAREHSMPVVPAGLGGAL